MTLHAPTWTAMSAIERVAPAGSAAQASGGTVARFVTSAWLSFDASMPPPRNASSMRSSSASMPPRPLIASWRAGSSDPGLVLPGPGVDADGVAGLDEDRHLDDEARGGRRRLAGAGLRVAGEARFRVDDLEVDAHGELDADRLALEARPVEGHPVDEVLLRV